MTYITYPKYPPVHEKYCWACHYAGDCGGHDVICRKCNTKMTTGIYIKQTYVGGMEDFAGDGRASTFYAGGTGEIDVCWKCPDCGRSVTKGT
jgi:hypothetical protein